MFTAAPEAVPDLKKMLLEKTGDFVRANRKNYGSERT